MQEIQAVQEMGVWSLGQEDPLKKEMACTPVFLPGKSHGQRSLVGYSLWDHRRVAHDLATWSLRKAFLSLLAILWNSAFKWEYLSLSPLLFTSLLFTAICKASSDNHFAFLHLFSMGMVLIPVPCTMSWTSIHSLSGTLSIRTSHLNLFLTSTI